MGGTRAASFDHLVGSRLAVARAKHDAISISTGRACKTSQTEGLAQPWAVTQFLPALFGGFSAVYIQHGKSGETNATRQTTENRGVAGRTATLVVFLLSKASLITLETTVTGTINAARGSKEMIDLTQGTDDIAPRRGFSAVLGEPWRADSQG
jgi:hypothetical protein